MTPADHQTMMRYLLQSRSEKTVQALFRNFTMANAGTLLIFFGYMLSGRMLHPLEWLKILVLSFCFFTSGWLADRLWFFVIGRTAEKPFSIPCYLGRAPFFFFLSGIFSILPMLWMEMIAYGDAIQFFLIGGLLQIVCQFPLQWFLFNRLRKMALLHL